jgi:hypothetical protein
VTWSFSAVVKMALRIELLQYWITQGDAFLFCIAVIHSRMCSGKMSIIRIDLRWRVVRWGGA